MDKCLKIYILFIAVCIVMPLSAQAQNNMYRYGSPNYWMAQSVLDFQAGKFDIAYEDLQKAHKGYEEVGDVECVFQAAEMMGMVKGWLGDWEKADAHYQEALQTAVDCKDDYLQSDVLTNMLTFYRTSGDIESYNHYQKTLDSLYAVSNSAKLKMVYHVYWANEWMGRKEYAMAETQLQRCLDVMPSLAFLDREQARLVYYNAMLQLKCAQKCYKEAIRYAKDYVKQTKNLNGRECDQQYQAYGNLCSVYALDNDSAQAFACLDSLECGVGHPYQDVEMVANFYNIKGMCYANFKKYEKAIEYYDKAYKILHMKRIEDSPSKFNSVKNKAMAYFMLKCYDEALAAYSELVDVSKNKYGESSLEYYEVLFSLANLEGTRGNISAADSLFQVSMNYLIGNMKRLWRYSTPTQREQFWIETLNNFSGMCAFALRCGNSDSRLTETCYNALLFSKSLLLESERTLVDIIRNEGTEDDIESYRQLLAVNNRILKLNSNYEHNKNEIDSLLICQRGLEQRLSSKCQSYKECDTYLDIDFQKVRNSLADNEVMIDFSCCMEEDSILRYAAYVFDKNKRYPVLVKCFTQQQFNSLFRGSQSFWLYDYARTKDRATKLLWEPLSVGIPKGSTVYYVPSGIMHSIALEALPLSDGTLLGQHYNFVRLTSARELLRKRDVKEHVRTAVLYGGLQYNLASEKMKEESSHYDKSDLAGLVRSGYGDRGFENLHNTKVEIEKISHILRSNGYDVVLYTGAKGNAESFVALSGKAASIVHIATHGFYYTSDEADGNDYLRGYTDAMSLSGLVFAGGNAAWLGKPNVEGVLGGILTANDIANLNLRGGDMIVLSACKTAQGKVTADGVYGLQRAFKKAGVGTIVMSLWSISDKATSEFMTVLYERLVDESCAWNKRKAFEDAKVIMRKRHPDPYYWAAFVMMD